MSRLTSASPLQRLGGLAVVAAIVVGLLVALSAGGSTTQSRAAVPPGQAAVDGIPERDGVLGSPSAPVVLTEYADLQCPVCRAFAEQTLPTVVRDYVKTGKVRLALQPLSFLGEDSVKAAKAADGAQAQGKLWGFVDRLFARQGAENSGWVTDEMLRSTLTAAGAADAGRALDHARSDDAQRRLDEADATAARYGIQSTPSFTITKGGKTEVLDADALDPASFTAALDDALAG